MPSATRRVLEPFDHAAPEGRADQNQRNLAALAGLDQRQRFHQLVQRAETAGHHDIGAGKADEHVLAGEEVAEGLRDVLVRIVLCSCGNWMFRPTDGDLPKKAPLLAASMIPGPPPEMTEKPESESRRAVCSANCNTANPGGRGRCRRWSPPA
jgi:hypothetical protein